MSPDRRFPVWRVGLLALALSGCASLQPTQAGLDALAVPAQWHAASATAAGDTPGDWWLRFGDPVLTGLVGRALAANSDIVLAQAQLREARATRAAASAALSPTLDASVTGQRTRNSGSDGASLYQAGLDASWEPDLFGAKRAAVRAADSDVAASGASLADVQVSIAAEVALAYVDLRSAQARLAIARSNLAGQEESLQIAQWRRQAGLVGEQDVLQARTAVEQTRAQLPPLQATIAQQANALAVLTGAAPGTLQAALEQASALPAAPQDLALRFPADTLRQRADVRGAEQRVLAAAARTDQAQAERYPRLQISGSLGLQMLRLAAGARTASSLLAGLTLPLLDGGAARANVDAKAALLQQTQATYRKTVLTALQDVEDALVALRTGRERVAVLQQAAEAAAAADELARQQYRAGRVSFLDVLETQRTLLTVQDSTASAQAEVLSSHVRLYKALGGAWQPEAAPSTMTTAVAANRIP